MRISDWSSDVCSSDLIRDSSAIASSGLPCFARAAIHRGPFKNGPGEINAKVAVGGLVVEPGDIVVGDADGVVAFPQANAEKRSEEHTSELQSLMRISYAVFCLKKKKNNIDSMTTN